MRRHEDFLPGSRYPSLESAIHDFEAAVAGAQGTVVADLPLHGRYHVQLYWL